MIHCGNPVAALMDYLANHHPVVVFSSCDIVQRNRDIEHLHKDLYQLSCVAGGESVLNFQSIHQEIQPNTFYIINPNELHSFYSKPGQVAQVATCRFQLPGYSHPLLRPRIALPPERIAEALGLIYQMQALMLKETPQDAVRAGLRLAELLLLLAEYCPGEEKEKYTSLVNTALDFINENFRSGIGVDAVATACGVSGSHLSRTFRKEMGITPQAFIHRLRLGYAQERLFRTDMKIADIAREAGFENSKNMNLAFKRTCKMSASSFRAQYQEKNKLEK